MIKEGLRLEIAEGAQICMKYYVGMSTIPYSLSTREIPRERKVR